MYSILSAIQQQIVLAGLTLTVISISAAETARDYNYNRYPNQRFVYTLGPNIYAGTYVVFTSIICGFIYLIFDWKNCCLGCVEDEEYEETINDEIQQVYQEKIELQKPKGDVNQYI